MQINMMEGVDKNLYFWEGFQLNIMDITFERLILQAS